MLYSKQVRTQNKHSNKQQNKQRKTNMTTQTIKLPNKVIDSDWKDDIAYEPYEDEGTYIPPSKVSRQTIAKIKQSSIKLSIDGLWKWKGDNKKVTA